MGFQLTAPPVSITRAELNLLNRGALGIIPDLRSSHRRWMERLLLRRLSPSEFKVLSAIAARTLAWNKVLEVIPLAVFAEGMSDGDHDEDFRRDDHGLPYFAGTGLNKSTIRAALSGLLSDGLIDRFSLNAAGRDVFAYIPVSFRTLVYVMATDLRFQPGDLPRPFQELSDCRSDLERDFARQFGGE